MVVNRAGVCGHPIGHSLSPRMHAAGYRAAGRDDVVYDMTDVTAAGLAEHLAGLDSSWVGLSLTMPLKQRALELVRDAGGTVDPVAAATGSVNTLVLAGRSGDGQQNAPAAFNTDVAGIVGAFAGAGITAAPTRCAVIGGGATAASATAAFTRLGADTVDVFARTPERAAGVERTAALLGARAVIRPLTDWRPQDYEAIVNTTPIGASDRVAGLVTHATGTLLDVVYDPWPTPLARSWADSGGGVIDGAAMLAHQAVGQIELFLAEADRRNGPGAGRAGDGPGAAGSGQSDGIDDERRAAIIAAVLAVVRERGD